MPSSNIDSFFNALLSIARRAPHGCNTALLLRLLAAWYGWIDAPLPALLSYALERDPRIVDALCRLAVVIERLYSRMISL